MFITEITIDGITDRDVADGIATELNRSVGIPVLVTLPDKDFSEDDTGHFVFSPTESATYKFLTNEKIDRSLIDKIIFRLRLKYDNVEITSYGVQASPSSFDVDVLSSLYPVDLPKKP